MPGLLHVRSEYSIKECALSVTQAVRHAAALGYDAVALADRESLSGTAELVRECRRAGLKPVPCVELANGLVIAAKDHTGYQGLCALLCGEDGLENLFGPGGRFHGHAAAFGGDMDGPVAECVCRNAQEETKRRMMQEELDGISAGDMDLSKAERDLRKQSDKLRSLEHEKALAEARSGKNFSRKEEAVQNETDPDRKRELENTLASEKEDCALAETELKRLGARIRNARKRQSVLAERVKTLKGMLTRKRELETVLGSSLEMADEQELVEDAARLAGHYLELFGEFYIELSYHGTALEADAMPLLARAAELAGVPTVLSGKILLLEPDDDELVRLHAARFLRDNCWTEPDPAEKAYYMRSEREMAASVEGLLPDKTVDMSLRNMERFFDGCSFQWDKAPQENQSLLLAERVENAGLPPEYGDRIGQELDAVKKAGLEQAVLIAAGTGWKGDTGDSLLCRALGLSDAKGCISALFEPVRCAMGIKGAIKMAFTENSSGTRPVAAEVPVQERIQAKAAIRLAGKALSSSMHEGEDVMRELAGTMADLIPGSESLSGFLPSLAEAFPDTDAEKIMDLAVHFEGILTGFGHGMFYAAAQDGVSRHAPFAKDGCTAILGFDAEGAEDCGLAVFRLDDTDCAALESSTAANIYHTRGIRMTAIPYDKDVFRNILKTRNGAGIPGCTAAVYDRLSSMDQKMFASLVSGEPVDTDWRGIYRCAWLKQHYPLEFMLAALNSRLEDIPLLIGECRRLGIKVLGPDINRSREQFLEENGCIRFGLDQVRGVGQKAQMLIRNRQGCYKGFVDFLIRSGADRNTARALIQAGAFDCFHVSRNALLFMQDRMHKQASKAGLLCRRIQEKQENLLSLKNQKAALKLERSLEQDRREAAFLMEALESVPFPDMEDTSRGRLIMEKNVLPSTVSPHPMDPYEDYLLDATPVAAAGESCGIWIAGCVSGYEVIHTKKNREMAVFTIEDKTGQIKVLCWPRTYERYRKFLRDDAVLMLYGDCRPAWKNPSKLEFHPSVIKSPVPKIRQTFVMADSETEWNGRILPMLQPYIDRHGSRVILYDCSTGQASMTDVYIKETEIPGIRSSRARTFLHV